MISLLIAFLLVTSSVLSADENLATARLDSVPPQIQSQEPPQPQFPLQTQTLPPPRLSAFHRPWHLNRVDCILADIVPKVSQRIALLKHCENVYLLHNQDAEKPWKKPSDGKKTPYLGWRLTPIVEVWNMKDKSMSEEVRFSSREDFPRGSGMFAQSLYKNLEEISPNTVSSTMGDNLAISPLVVEVALACLMLGARHDTGKEINRFLDVTPESLPLKYRSTISQLQLKRQSSIKMVNLLHLEESFFPVKEDFSRQLLEIFDARIEKANFHAGASAERERINSIVAMSTEGHVSDALTPDVVNEQTQLLLVNTLYFKARWENQFQIRSGFNGAFYLTNGKTVDATYMSRDPMYYHYKENIRGKYKMLELPFQSENDDPGLYSMIVILPDEVNGLEDVENHLTSDDSWLKDFDLVSTKDTQIVDPRIPRFTIDSKANLKNALNKMEIFLLFEENSDFGNINEQRNIKTSKIYQRIYLDVNEKGANVPPRAKSLPGTGKEDMTNPVQFHAKHPFMFVIVQRVTKSVLVMGRVMKPNFDELFAKNSEDLKK